MTEVSAAGTLRQLYRRAMQMEVDFFKAQPGTSSAPSVGMLVVDFDDTCTATDTTSQIFNAAIAAAVENASGTAGQKKLCTSSVQCALGSQRRMQHAMPALFVHFKCRHELCCRSCMINRRSVQHQLEKQDWAHSRRFSTGRDLILDIQIQCCTAYSQHCTSAWRSRQTASHLAHVCYVYCMQTCQAAFLSLQFGTLRFVCELVDRQKQFVGCTEAVIAGSVLLSAESTQSTVRSSLEAKRDQLVRNYVQEQRKLYSELLPEVKHSFVL